MSWTEEKVAKLKELWSKGHTASQIAAELGYTQTLAKLVCLRAPLSKGDILTNLWTPDSAFINP